MLGILRTGKDVIIGSDRATLLYDLGLHCIRCWTPTWLASVELALVLEGWPLVCARCAADLDPTSVNTV